MRMNARMTGALCGITAAVCYGTNPLGALPLYAEGVNSATVLFYRFSLAALILGLFMLARGTSFALTKKAFAVTAVLGVVFGFSALTLFLSFHLMDAGIASTILFTYPVFVALIMAVFFREKPNAATVISIVLALAGVGLLYQGGDGAALNLNGMLLVLLSSLLYAGYIVIVNRASPGLSAVRLTFFVLIFCSLTMAGWSLYDGSPIALLQTPKTWFFAGFLACVPTVLSLGLMAVAVREIGSTPTAVMGALEPLTAVVIGVTVFGEAFTLRLACGIVLILASVLLIVAGKSLRIPLAGKRRE